MDELKYFKHYLINEESLSGSTVKAYMSDVKDYVRFSSEVKSDVTDYNTLLLYLKELFKKGYSIETILRRLSGIKCYFDYLIKEKKLNQNPVLLIDKPKKWFKLPEFLTEDEIKKILHVFDENNRFEFRDKVIILLLYSSGLRISELVSLKVSDCDLKRGVLKVKGKGEKERFVPVNKNILELLEKYLYMRSDYFVKERDVGYLFLSKNGKKLNREYVWSLIKKYAARAGITKNISPHSFRHTFATHLLKNGADLRVIQMLLGHSSITTTEIYTQLEDDVLRENLLKYHPRFSVHR